MIGDRITKTDKFAHRDVVLEVTDGNYKQYPVFQFSNDRMDAVDNFRTGQAAKIHFNLRGREYNGRYFNTLDAWKIE